MDERQLVGRRGIVQEEAKLVARGAASGALPVGDPVELARPVALGLFLQALLLE
jgi:hypothetical protein